MTDDSERSFTATMKTTLAIFVPARSKTSDPVVEVGYETAET
jgi:hypothetical protein